MVGYLFKKTHISWVITAIAGGMLLGVALVKLVNVSDVIKSSWPLLILAFILITITVTSRLRLLLPVAVLAGCTIGILRAAPVLQQLDNYDVLVGDKVTIKAVIQDDPSFSKKGVALNLGNVAVLDTKTNKYITYDGRLWTRLSDRQQDIKRADMVELVGTVEAGFGAYGATLTEAKLIRLERRNGADILGGVRNDFADKLGRSLNQTQVGLGMGLLAGQKSGLDDNIQSAFVAAALTHILVASGYNLTILVRFARRLFAKHSRVLALILSIILIMMFVGITGNSASMTRAATVSIISLLTWYVGRHIHPVSLIILVASFTVMLSPSQLWGDVGWYLSFTSFIGVIILAPILTTAIVGTKNKGDEVDLTSLAWSARLARKIGLMGISVRQILIETLCAQLLTWPIIALFMGKVSIAGLLTNVLVLPLIPMTMAMTFMTGIAGYIVAKPLLAILAYPAAMLLDFIVAVADWGTKLPGSDINLTVSTGFVTGYYLILLIAIFLLRIRTKHNFYQDNIVE